MVSDTIHSVLKAEHEMDHLVESSTDGSTDATEREFQELRRVTEQAIKTTENWGRQALNKTKEHVEEISV